MDIAAAIIGGIVTLLVSVIGVVTARKSGLGFTQDKLITNLKDLVETQDDKIRFLEQSADENRKRIETLEGEVMEFKKLTVRQAKIITKLMRANPSVAITGADLSGDD